ncbi:HTH-type transcriptional regulator TsaR [Pandoraea eparura]|uniref:HTH-type transcriptional regulator TsaR n=1 Tax=Pandoraea eparura TaxID=2508291 RepID=A0A5E4YNR4_9BURK|nr:MULTISPECIES: LysR family transcriptional regulator [Burkholderiaceae]VVE50045.1 HTH-type transcriptional regulator TsaR [Pandoraea eparura]
MKHHQLRALVAIATSGSVSAAARSLSVTQTAVTKAIKELEEDIHTPLLIRTPQGARLTPIGLELVERAKSILSDIEDARAHVERLSGGGNHRVSAAAIPAFFSRHLAEVFSMFRSRYPDVQLTLQDSFLSTSLPKLRDGTLDVTLTTILPECIGSDLEFQQFCEIEIVLMAQRGMFNRPVKNLGELVDYPWVTDGSSCGGYEAVRRTFTSSGYLLPTNLTESPSSLSSLVLVEQCGCIAPSPALFLGGASVPPGIVKIDLKQELPKVPFGLLLRRGAKLSPSVEWMCECFRAITRTPGWDKL